MLRVIFSIIPLCIAFVFYNIVNFIQGNILQFIGLIPLFLFHFMIPITHIYTRVLCDYSSPYDVACYYKPINLAISLCSLILLVYLFISLIISYAN